MTFSLDNFWEFGWRTTALLAVTLFAAGLLKRRLLLRQTVLQCGVVWLLTLPVAMLLPRINWSVLPPPQVTVPTADRNSTVTAASHQERLKRPVPTLPQLSHDATRKPISIQPQPVTAPVISKSRPASAVVNKTQLPLPASHESAQHVTPFWSVAAIGVTFYLSGCLLLFGRLVVGLWQLQRLGRSASVIEDAAWTHDLDACCLNQGMTQHVSLMSSTTLSTPLTYGWWRPVLIVPASLVQGCTVTERRAILLHELTHIQRRDFGWICALQVVRAIYWCHPLSWFFARYFAASQEEVCDAICVGEFGTQSYLEALLSVASTTHRPVVLTLGLAMSRSSRLSHRLVRIQQHGGLLMSRLSRRSLVALLMLVLPVGIATLLVQPVRAQPQPVASPPVEKLEIKPAASAPAPKVAKPGGPTPAVPAAPRVVLQLVDEHGQALKSTAVKVRRYREVDGRYELDQSWTDLKSNDNGVVEVPTDDVKPTDPAVGLIVEVADRAPHMEGFKVVRTAEVDNPPLVKLLPALSLKTRVFDADGRPVPNARLTLRADTDPDSYKMWELLCVTNADGRVELNVPLDTVFGLIVTTEQGAPYRLVCPNGTKSLSNIHLQRGCVVAGQLLDRDGKPVPNCNVVLEGEDSQAIRTEFEVKRHGGGSLDLEFQRRTDAEGRFRFPPMVGDVRVYLDCNSNQPVPMIIPVEVKLPETGEKWLPLMLAPTGRISGTARWPDGKPVTDRQIALEIPPNISNSYINLSSTRTDAEGKYSLTVPFPLEQGFLTGHGAPGPDGKYWEMAPKVTTPNNPHGGWHPLERYLGETATVDWVMVPREEPGSGKPTEPPAVDAAWQPLAQLELEIEAARNAYRAAPDGDAQDQLDPRYTMVNRCLEFEVEHRGTRLGVGALYYVMRAAATVIHPSVNSARTRAIEVLDQHYLAHPDVDLLISDFDAGGNDPTAEPFLQHLIDQSPFAHVRAAALFQLAASRFDFLHLAENIYNTPLQSDAEYDAMLRIQTTESARDWVRNQRAEAVRFHAAMKGVDLAQLRQGALQLLDRTVNNYSGVKAPRRRWVSASGIDDAFELKLVDLAGNETWWRIRTIAERADVLRFQQSRLQRGMTAPEIEGFDYHQRPIRLSQFKGKVVLLAVGLGPSDDELTSKMTKLIANLQAQPLQCLSVIPGSGDGGWSVRAIVEDNKITWPIIRDTVEDEVQTRWCQQTFPEVYLIDQQGIIRHHLLGDHVSAEHLESLARELLQTKTTEIKR